MDKGKKKIIIIFSVLLIFISIIVIIISQNNHNDNDVNVNIDNNGSINNDNNNNNENIVINTKMVNLTDEKLYFNVQATINNYYHNLVIKNNDFIYNILENEYKKENNITKSNVTDKIYSNYEIVSFIANKIIYNENSTVTYYFINGYLFNQTMMEDDFSYEKSVNYLLIEKNNNYVIRPLDNNIDIETYANNYNKKDISIDNNIQLSKNNISEKSKLTLYINEFLNLLFLDTDRAYSMLDENTKNKYVDYYDFENQIENIYNSLTSYVFSYAIKEKDDYTYFKVKDKNLNVIEVFEYNVMNYKIGF